MDKKDRLEKALKYILPYNPKDCHYAGQDILLAVIYNCLHDEKCCEIYANLYEVEYGENH